MSPRTDKPAPGTEQGALESPSGAGAVPHPAAPTPPPVQPAALRVHKALAQAGIASRREAERLVRSGQVRVNGRVSREIGLRLNPGDELQVDGRVVRWGQARDTELWALYKPKRCVSTLDDPEGRPCLKDFFPPTKERLYPIGRLDYDAEGLILLTNDGELAQHVAHPSHGVPRYYVVKVKGLVQQETLARLAQGQELDGRRRSPARARVLHTLQDKTWLDVTLREGIHHHLKKMFAAVGHPVLKIKRYQIGAVELGELQPGQYRKLGKADMHRLLSLGDDIGHIEHQPPPVGQGRTALRHKAVPRHKTALRQKAVLQQKAVPRHKTVQKRSAGGQTKPRPDQPRAQQQRRAQQQHRAGAPATRAEKRQRIARD